MGNKVKFNLKNLPYPLLALHGLSPINELVRVCCDYKRQPLFYLQNLLSFAYVNLASGKENVTDIETLSEDTLVFILRWCEKLREINKKQYRIFLWQNITPYNISTQYFGRIDQRLNQGVFIRCAVYA